MTDDPDDVHAFLTIDAPLGDTRLPVQVDVRADGFTMITIGDEDVADEYDTLCDVEQLSTFIDMLTIARDCARAAAEGELEGEGTDGSV